MASSILAILPDLREYIAIIPARGGSKRLPGKNVRIFGGFPLIVHSIAYAKACPLISRVVVSTDSEDIADIARKNGAEVIMRPAELATDLSKTGTAIRHVLQTLAQEGYQPDGVVTLQPTNPLRPANLLMDTLAIYENESPDSVISVSRSTHKIGTVIDGFFTPTSYRVEQRSQDLAPKYFENGLLYITKPEVVLDHENVFGETIRAFEVDSPYATVDIDEEVHFIVGEQLFERYRDDFAWIPQSTRRNL